MSVIGDLVKIEMRGARGKGISEKVAQMNVIKIFVCVFLGIFVSFLYEFLLKFIENPSSLVFNLSLFIAELLLSVIIAPLIFIPIYKLLDVNSSETWMILFVAFQNGFLWRDILGGGVSAGVAGASS